ncbi:MAG: hypothetical protein N3J91_02480 [Verrucomicrobiae bacterium]|nr:hypothetical protein [Verrucomicrobiae bacterium]
MKGNLRGFNLGAILALVGSTWMAFTATPVESLKFSGEVDTNQASFVLTGRLKGGGPAENEAPLIYSATWQAALQFERSNILQHFELRARVLQGQFKEWVLRCRGEGNIEQVTGAGIKDWALRRDAQGQLYLVIRPADAPTNIASPREITASVTARHAFAALPVEFTPLLLQPHEAAFAEGTLEIQPDPALELSLTNLSGLLLVQKPAAAGAGTPPALATTQPLMLRWTGGEYALRLRAAEKDAEGRQITLSQFQLTGLFKDQRASFTLQAEAIVRHAEGGTLPILAGDAALTSFPTNAEAYFAEGRYWLRFRRPGTYPLTLTFDARISTQNEWNALAFEVAPSALRPVVLKGLPAETLFNLGSAARPERQGEDYLTFLPSSGPVQWLWRTARKEERGRLFYAVEGHVGLSVGPGLLRQVCLLNYKVMQGELNQLVLLLQGEGEVTHVRGEDILAWRLEPASNGLRRLVVQLNQPRKDTYSAQVLLQTPLGAFPVNFTPPRLAPAEAIRYSGYLVAMNDGAVRLETFETRGLSQISPEMAPQREALVQAGLGRGTQTFAYRFSGPDYALSLQAEQMQPEVNASQLLAFHLGETETLIDAELELDIRDAPLREFTVRVPADYTNPRLNAQHLSDYFLTTEPNSPLARLRLVFSQPLMGRQVVQLRLSKNTNAAAGAWTLPQVQPVGVKSLRLHVGVSADTGFRLTAGEVSGLTELPPGLFPRKIAGLQLAWRLRDESWQAIVQVERLAQTVLADVVHLFTLKEGMAYCSSVINYWVGGAPINQFRVAVPTNYGNVEFAGRDVRNWKPVPGGYEVYLNTPAFGAYTLLVTCDRQFHTRTNNQVDFEGARPLDAQTEQGSVLVISEHAFEARPVEVSPQLLKLDPREIPPDHRLLFDAPLLAAYQYTARPFNLRMELLALPPGETMRQVADRALLHTRITREGELATTARYFIKNQGHNHLRVKIPAGYKLWEARVNQNMTAPVTDGPLTLVPLPAKTDPLAVLTVELKLAAKAPDRHRLPLEAPTLEAPILQTEWRLQADPGTRLRFKSGRVVPVGAWQEPSGWNWLTQALSGEGLGQPRKLALGLLPVLLVGSVLVFRRAARPGMTRGSTAQVLATLGGLLGAVCTLVLLGMLVFVSLHHTPGNLQEMVLIAPIQDPGQTLALQVEQWAAGDVMFWLRNAWPAALALALWIFAAVKKWTDWKGSAVRMAGWTLLAWGALRLPGGAPWFFGVLALFALTQLWYPAWQAIKRLPPAPKPEPPTPSPASPDSATGAATALLLGSALLAFTYSAAGAPAEPTRSVVQSVLQQMQVQEEFLRARAVLVWQTEAGERLDFLAAPAVLTKIQLPTEGLVLSQSTPGGGYRLTARTAGRFEVTFEYQLRVGREAAGGHCDVPTLPALVNRVTLDLDRADLQVSSAEAVSVEVSVIKQEGKEFTRAELVLAPRANAKIHWAPRSRDPRRETAVLYAELHHLYLPTPGLVEGIHLLQLKPAQGIITEVTLLVPTNQTITDVRATNLAHWRFDPDSRQLRAVFQIPQTQAFPMWMFSQIPAGALPYEAAAGLPVLQNAAGQLGTVGVASGQEVQLQETVKVQGLTPINLEDFPPALLQEAGQFLPGLTLRRAYRYSAGDAQITLAAAPVQPDIRVTSQETHSLGEDRAVLALQWSVDITRAGIFRLSFALPADFDLENVSSPVLSHWTELRAGGERIITLHLRGKTEGRQNFNLTLGGPGLARRKEWSAPRVLVREATRQAGQLVVVPEQGMRLHARERDGVNPVDPRRAGLTQKGVLAFALLQSQWRLVFDVEAVEPWVEAAILQHCALREGLAQVTGAIEYRIDNAGVKSLLVLVPQPADSVRFEGELFSDAVRLPVAGNARWQEWEVKLQRRVIGNYTLRLSYQMPFTNQASVVRLSGIRARSANLERGYLAVQGSGRLQLRLPTQPNGLQPVEWQAIPTNLRRSQSMTESKDCFMVLDNSFELPITLSRHEVADVLPAQVESLTLTSVIAPSGQMLTEGRLVLRPGDKRLLRMKLPPESRFWYAFINGQSVWPWREGGQILFLLEKHSEPNQPTTVEFFYTATTRADGNLARREMLGPSFDLPLENITWNVYAPATWDIRQWQTALQLRSAGAPLWPTGINVDDYLKAEMARRDEKVKTAEQLFNLANTMLQQGAPQQAQRAFQAAWNISPQDAAFNEDARVQWNNVRLQQTLLGLNERRLNTLDIAERKEGRARNILGRVEPGQAPQYTQQQAQQVLERNSPDENAALQRLAERLLRQQIAGVTKPESIRAALPLQGRPYQFTGALVVDEWATLKIGLQAKASDPQTATGGLALVVGLFLALLVLYRLRPGA